MTEQKWTLKIGIHRGTLTSRDHEQPKKFDDREAALAEYYKAKKWYRSIAYQIWYAELVSPDGEKEMLEQNSYY